ncbi:MAG: pyridoxal-phosphate dependent enzyme [Pseudomonadota bacterium]
MTEGQQTSRIQIARIEEAARAIDPVFLGSPQFASSSLSEALGCTVTVKLETTNPIRCFKGRGADWLIGEAQRAGDDRAIVCASAGNFGQGIAYAATRAGRSVTIYAAETANPLKIERMRALGGTVVLAGADFDAAKAAARVAAERDGARMVEDSLDIQTVEGAGTIGLELCARDACPDIIVVPIGNGAMINGIATAMKARKPDVEIVGVQATGAPAMEMSWRQNQPVETETVETIADGIAIRVPVPEAVADMCGLVDDVCLVDDAHTVTGVRMLHAHVGVVAEPSAGITVGALLAHRDRFAGRHVGIIVCGGNLTEAQINTWLVAA